MVLLVDEFQLNSFLWGICGALLVNFGPSAYEEDPIRAFTKLRQTNSEEEYQTQFGISNRISGLTKEFRISTFICGLRYNPRIIVTMIKPSTLSAAFGLARLQEDEDTRRAQKETTLPLCYYVMGRTWKGTTSQCPKLGGYLFLLHLHKLFYIYYLFPFTVIIML